MRIIQLTPGAGGDFYCENCLRDGTVVRTIRARGHDMLMVPLYLPLRVEQAVPGAQAPMFFGGINVYLQQRWSLFRHTPRWLDALLDSRALLRRVARKAGMTKSSVLGESTLSMLRGADGLQVKELDRLVDWLADQPRPDVVCLSNALLSGLIPRIRERLGAPVVCTLQDEDGFIDALGPPYAEKAWELLRGLAKQTGAYIAVSRYYADVMRRRLDVPEGKVHAVLNGLDATEYAPATLPPDPPAVGFLSQMAESKGLELLVEAFIRLKRTGQFGSLKLRIAGGRTDADEACIARASKRLKDEGVVEDAEFLDTFDAQGKREFLRSLSVMSVPTIKGEAFGLFVLEALACGVPVALPRHGAFVELVESTGGGVLCESNDADALASALAGLLDDPDKARGLGAAGREAVLRDLTAERQAEGVLEVFESIAKGSDT
jgi:glycosyltransferase involved in cell wall biosynthesis